MGSSVAPLIGFHCGVGRRNGVGDYMRRLDEAALPFALCSVDDDGLIGEALSYTNADHWIVFRPMTDAWGQLLEVPQHSGNASSYNETVQSHYQRVLSALRRKPNVEANKDRVWVSILNEVDQDQHAFVDNLCLGVAILLNDMGYKVVLPNWATGSRYIDDLDTPEHLALLRYAGENRDKCAIGIHEYSLDDDLFNGYPYLVGRWQFYIDVCDEHGIPYPQFIVKEFGMHENHALDASAVIPQLRELMQRDRPDIPRMFWGMQPWHGTITEDTERLVTPITDFVLSERFEVEHEPPDIEEAVSMNTLADVMKGDGKIRFMRHNFTPQNNGAWPTFPIQHQVLGNTFYEVAGNEFRRFYFDDTGNVYMDFDTSQGGGLFYTQQDEAGKAGALWGDASLEIGHQTHRNPTITHRQKSDCAVTGGGHRVGSWLQVVARHATYKLPNGITLGNVTELLWEHGERYFYWDGKTLAHWISADGTRWTYLDRTEEQDGWLERETLPCHQQLPEYYKPLTPVIEPPTVEPPIIEPVQPVYTFGIDISHHQNPDAIDFSAENMRNIDYGILRGGYGTTRDSLAWPHYKKLKDNGKLVGAYWFIDRRFDGYQSGVEFGEFVNAFQWDLPAWIDAEDNNNSIYGLLTPTKQQVIDFCRGYLSVATWPVGTYTNRHFWRVTMGSMDPHELGITNLLWLADWDGDDTGTVNYVPTPFDAVQISQELARVIGGVNLDFNTFYGTRDEMDMLAVEFNNAGLTDMTAPPIVEPEPEPIVCPPIQPDKARQLVERYRVLRNQANAISAELTDLMEEVASYVE